MTKLTVRMIDIGLGRYHRRPSRSREKAVADECAEAVQFAGIVHSVHLHGGAVLLRSVTANTGCDRRTLSASVVW